MEMVTILLANGFFLALILLFLLTILSKNGTSRVQPRNVKEDLKKIKEQVENSN